MSSSSHRLGATLSRERQRATAVSNARLRRRRLKLITLPWELEVPTLSLASLAAVTPAQFDIAIVDLLRERLFFDEDVDLVGITASTPRINAAYALADRYRARGVKVVIGGHHATALPEEALEHADAVVCGEGESAWQRICEDLLGNPSRVGGIYREPAPDPTTLPQPRIDLMKIERYNPYTFPVIASRGCPEACSFCFAKRMTNGYRTYPIAHVIEQVRRRPAFVKSMYFVDDNLAGDLDYTRELFRELAKYKVPFVMQVRHEFSADPENLRMARAAGCVAISSGYESINQATLANVGKRALAEQYGAQIDAIFDEGILPSGNWVFGFDWDTPSIFEETLDFILGSKLLHCAITSEIPFPGTPSFRRYEREGRIASRNYDDYTGGDGVVVRPKQMTTAQLRDGIRWLALQYYSPRRALERARWALANPRIGGLGSSALRAASLYFLNFFQTWQYQYRMRPGLHWLYRRIESVNKHRFLGDHVRRTNFGVRSWERADDHLRVGPPSFDTSSPFLRSGGVKAARTQPLVPSRMRGR